MRSVDFLAKVGQFEVDIAQAAPNQRTDVALWSVGLCASGRMIARS
jgi:hypothetical protein